MVNDPSRRQALLSTLGGVLAFSLRPVTTQCAEALLVFWVAGVRYQPILEQVTAGDKVKLIPERHENKFRYAVVTEWNDRLGFVPKEMIELIFKSKNVNGVLTVVDYDSVPWKRFQVEIT